MNLSQSAEPAQPRPQPAPERVSWQKVYGDLSAAEADTLTAEELESLADAAFWLGCPRESIVARQRAYRRHRHAHDGRRTTMAAWRLFYSYFDLDATAAASGWIQRAHRHALEVPDEIESHYVALADADWALYNGRLDDALARARQADDAGRQFDDRDLEALGVATQGRVLVARGDVSEGVDRLDEAMAASLSGELSPFAIGWIHCLLLSTCQELGDVRRAAEWTDVAIRWSEESGEHSWYPGLCRLHRCEVQSLRGEWTVAEREALRAAEELAPFGDYLIADGHYLAGEIRRRRGDSAGAEEAFRRAHELGRDPQPGLALLRLAQGDAKSAATALGLALSGGSGGQVRRGRLLAAHIDAELRLGNVEAARASAEELRELAAASRALYLRAMAASSHGAVLLADDDIEGAVRVLREACDMCRDLSCPYEAAEARVLLGVAARRAGDEQTARLEFEAARAIFEQLGAVPGVDRVNGLLAADTLNRHGLTAREVDVLRQAAQGKSNQEIALSLFISQHTVARHLGNIFRKLDVTSRSAATAFAYENDLA
jgi:DNA-binding CsgD family transcriptional regulator